MAGKDSALAALDLLIEQRLAEEQPGPGAVGAGRFQG
jgi:hypothetical protein